MTLKAESSRELAEKTHKETMLEEMIKQIKMYTVKVKPTKVKPIDHPEK